MMRMVTATIGSAALVAAFAGHKTPDPAAFSFTVDPSELATEEGRDRTAARLEREARHHCTRRDQSLAARRGARRCVETAVANARLALMLQGGPSLTRSPTLPSEGDLERP